MLAGSITAAKLAGSIGDDKLNQLTTADKVAGSAVQLATGGGLTDATGLKIDAAGVTNAMLAGSIADSKPQPNHHRRQSRGFRGSIEWKRRS